MKLPPVNLLAIILYPVCASLAAERAANAKDDALAVLSGANPAASPTPREKAWVTAHGKREARLQQGNADVLLIGDSITAGWSKHPDLLQKVFRDRQVVNLGHPADKTENILWRIRNHSFDKVSPGVAIVLAGTNNSNNEDHTPDQIAGGVQAIVAELRNKLPQTKILLLCIFPRGSSGQRLELKSGRTAAQMNPQWEKINGVNRTLSEFADGRMVVYLDINREFLNGEGELPVDVMPDLLHPNAKGYEIWGRAIQPVVERMTSSPELGNLPPRPIAP